MSGQGYDDMGPRIDLGQDSSPGYDPPAGSGASAASIPPPLRPRSGGSGLGMAALAIAIIALVVAIWGATVQPEVPLAPPMSPGVVPGGTGERVAKLEKDVSDLMLRLVSLEKELDVVRSKAGAVNQIAQLSAKVAALQGRMDSKDLDRKMGELEKRSSSPAPAPQAVNQPKSRPQTKIDKKPAPKPAVKPKAKKKTYTVRRGDTLFTVAQRYQVRMRDLMKWNKMKRGDILKVGHKLVIYK